MPRFVAYYRVSTDRQGISGLGLDAQREAVSRFVAAEPMLAEFQEIESGKSHTNRPQLTAAMELCRKQKATLVIAKLDRLARDVHFISGLMKSGVEFVAVDMPHANRLTVHILAAVAEHEREVISVRTKVALAQVKKRGTRLGNPRWKDTLHLAREVRNPLSPSPKVVQIVQQQREEGRTLRAIVEHLHGLGIMTPYGNHWHAKTVRDLLSRIVCKPHMRERSDMFQNSAEGNTHDPCSQPYQVWGSRAAVLTICFLTMLLGSIAVYYWLQGFSFRLQAATVVGETAAVILYTFSKNRDNNPPYLYSCPIVQSQFPKLIRRHILFLLGIVVLETVAFELRSHLSTWWLTSTGRNETPFITVLAILTGIIALVQITTNRSLLERAHSA